MNERGFAVLAEVAEDCSCAQCNDWCVIALAWITIPGITATHCQRHLLNRQTNPLVRSHCVFTQEEGESLSKVSAWDNPDLTEKLSTPHSSVSKPSGLSREALH